MSRLRIAVIGAGRLGRIHARLLTTLPEAELVAVVDPLPDAREPLARELEVRSAASHREIMSEIDAAVVASPTVEHHPICAELLAGKIHVLVEKPMAPTASQAQDLVAIAHRHRRILQVGHVERFNPAFQAAQAYCDEPCYIEAHRTSGFTCRSTDIGVVLDLMIHDLDLVLSMTSSELVDVQAVGTAVFGPHEDMAQARLRFANGCVANLTASRTSYTAQRSMQIYHRTGFVSIDFGDKTATSIRPDVRLKNGLDVNSLTECQRDAIRTRLFDDYLLRRPIVVDNTNAILEEQRDFLQCIRTGAVPRVSAESACRAVEVAEWIQEEIGAYLAALHRPATIRLPQPAPLRRQAG